MAKMSKEQAEYRDGNPINHCGICVHYRNDGIGSCNVVEGDIDPYMLSSLYQALPNPLRAKGKIYVLHPAHRRTLVRALHLERGAPPPPGALAPRRY